MTNAANATPAQPRTPADLEAEIAAIRARMAENLNELNERVHPRNVAKRTTEKVADVVDTQVGVVKDKLGYNRAQGPVVRLETIGKVAFGVVVAVVVVRGLRRGR